MTEANSAGRLLAILDVFSEDHLEWTIDELMAQLGYSRPTLYRYLKTLRAAGFLSSSPDTGFTLGPRVVEMDFLMRRSDRLIDIGQNHLERLAKTYPCSAMLVRWYGEKMLCVSSVCAIPNPISSYPRGRPMPLLRGAISRAIMANLPRRKLLPMIKANLPELAEIGLGQTLNEVSEALRLIRRAGFAVAHGEVTPGVVGIASPVFDAGTSPIAACCVTIPAKQVTKTLLDQISTDVKDAASAISNQMAGHPAAEKDNEA